MAATPTRPPADLLARYRAGREVHPNQEAWILCWFDEVAEAGAVYDAIPTAAEALAIFAEPPTVDATPSPEAQRIIRAVTAGMESTVALVPTSESIGPYEILRELGRGGMGVVYEAIDKRLNRRVALKVMRSSLAADANARERFLREARAAAGIKSDHVVGVYEVAEEDGNLLLAMEFVDGEPLHRWRAGRPGPITVADVLRVARDVLVGLAAAHENGIVHRDLKPSNVLWDRGTGRFKLADFGLVAALEAEDSLTPEGAVVGTPAYMAPEQAAGQPVDHRADLYSLGVLLFRMAQGVPLAVQEFLARLMAHDPDNRPANAEAALEELRAVEDQFALAPPPPARPRRWLLATGFALAVVLGVVALASRPWAGAEEARPEPPAVAPGNNAVPAEKPRPPEPVALRVGVRVVVTEQAAGYADAVVGGVALVVQPGWRGEVAEEGPAEPPENQRFRIRFDEPVAKLAWVRREFLAPLE